MVSRKETTPPPPHLPLCVGICKENLRANAWFRPEDIFGSVQVDGHGEIQGTFQSSGTYRILTNEGM